MSRGGTMGLASQAVAWGHNGPLISSAASNPPRRWFTVLHSLLLGAPTYPCTATGYLVMFIVSGYKTSYVGIWNFSHIARHYGQRQWIDEGMCVCGGKWADLLPQSEAFQSEQWLLGSRNHLREVNLDLGLVLTHDSCKTGNKKNSHLNKTREGKRLRGVFVSKIRLKGIRPLAVGARRWKEESGKKHTEGDSLNIQVTSRGGGREASPVAMTSFMAVFIFTSACPSLLAVRKQD